MRVTKGAYGLVPVAAAVLLAAALLDSFAPGAAAQCALCRRAAEGAGEAAARALNLGILVLLVPPVAIFCGIFAVAFRIARREDEDGRRDARRARNLERY